MVNLDVQHLSKRIGDLVLLDDVNFSLAEGQRLGLIARNGTGKTTLLRILAGMEGYEEGQIVYRNNLRVGYLEQDTRFTPELTVREAVFGQIPEGEDEDRAALRLEQVLTRLGITALEQLVGTLSGGQLKRVALAAVLAQDPDILILDEPTNHLDIEMTEWLEGYLSRQARSLLLVTHDRYFLNRICTDIIEIDGAKIYHYDGNYEYYLEKRQQRIDATNASIDRARNLYRTELEWMRRMPQARGHKARYRVEAFDDLEKLAHTRQDNGTARLEMQATYIGSKIFEAEYVCKAFADAEDGREKVILRNFCYTFSRYEKMAIVGANGTGKSTFIKMLLGLVKPDSGRFVVGETVRFGYFSQEGMQFDEQMKVIDAVRKIAEVVDLGGGRRLTAMQFLSHFLFPPRRQQDYIYKLSGGERRRLHLCTVLMQQPNFLILDEPTNDLDIDTLQILEDYLANFRGCVIVVSHDRYFSDKVADHLLVFHGNGEIEDFPGDYSQYQEKAKSERRAAERPAPSVEAPAKKKEWVGEQKARRITFKERQELAALETEIESLEAEKAEIEQALCSGTLDADTITAHARRLPELTARLDEAADRWLELSELAV